MARYGEGANPSRLLRRRWRWPRLPWETRHSTQSDRPTLEATAIQTQASVFYAHTTGKIADGDIVVVRYGRRRLDRSVSRWFLLVGLGGAGYYSQKFLRWVGTC